jgi:hypothetical protein
MTFGPIKVGGWGTNDTLTSAQITEVQDDLENALDGAGGGPYSPSTQLAISGSGVYVVPIASIATLQAINTTSLPDGERRTVTGYGCYQLAITSAGNSDAQDLPLCVQPTTGPGRWLAVPELAAEAIAKYTHSFTAASTSWTSPRSLSLIEVDMCGGGGGGGGGIGADTTSSDTIGGGGGAGARRTRQVLSITPAYTYTIAAGVGGTGGTAGNAGTDGGNSGIIDPAGPTLLLEGLGGQGGSGAVEAQADTGSSRAALTPGGSAPSSSPKQPCFSSADIIPWPVVEQGGGYATNSQAANLAGGGTSAGGNSAQGGSGGAAGARGSTNGGHIGGGGGGGGGAGPFAGSNGGTGGLGGNGQSGVGSNGSIGIAGSGNGAGGGGGGGGGQGGTAGSSGAQGGTGSVGIVTIRGLA